jgi:hypothetical protein
LIAEMTGSTSKIVFESLPVNDPRQRQSDVVEGEASARPLALDLGPRAR